MLVKRLIFFIILALVMAMVFVSCTPAPSPTAPTAITGTNPSNGSTGVPLNKVLSWTGGDGATSYEVYFGTNANPSYAGSVSTKSFTPSPSPLATGTTYYWKVVAKNSLGQVDSGVKSFTTAFAVDIRGTWVVREKTDDGFLPNYLPLEIQTQNLITGEANGYVFNALDPATQFGFGGCRTDTEGNVTLNTSAIFFVFWSNTGTVSGAANDLMTGTTVKSFLLNPDTYNGTFRAEKMNTVSFPSMAGDWSLHYISGTWAGITVNFTFPVQDGFGYFDFGADRDGVIAPSGFSTSEFKMKFGYNTPSEDDDAKFTGELISANRIEGTYTIDGVTGNFEMTR